MVSTHLKNISQNGNLPQIGVKIKLFETTAQALYNNIGVNFSNFSFSLCMGSKMKLIGYSTLPETNIDTKIGYPKRKPDRLQPSIFRCKLADFVSGRVTGVFP